MRRPDFRIEQDTFLTPFLCLIANVSMEDERHQNSIMKIRLLFATVIATFMMAFVSCNGDKSGDYKLVDIDLTSSTISNREYERGLAEGLGSIWHFEKIGDRYKLSMDGEKDVLIFSPDGDEYSAHNGALTLTFTSSGAILRGTDGDKKATWTLEKL